ncbi:30S ribosomal protein S20 [Thermodesulfobium narugense DSM 14796]|uniref:Small ribosomal subunit protein bS20 n=1 Tax=Thermodesulfobium narugense DSM 14796 TaxID=747365 RepID=M1E765_9BACT|nr:30S ribosomal protein S20 [Thermodesulfobium narugense]AEE14513.1 30S ribosomal protein S20 [Thermodesulfobium narugense DSM 14796]
MPVTRTATRALRKSLRKKQHNQSLKSATKTIIKNFEKFISSEAAPEQREKAIELFKKAVSSVDKIAKKGIFAKNKAARKKSQLQIKLNKFLNQKTES